MVTAESKQTENKSLKLAKRQQQKQMQQQEPAGAKDRQNEVWPTKEESQQFKNKRNNNQLEIPS